MSEIPCIECQVFQETKTHPERALICETARAVGDCLMISRLAEADNLLIKHYPCYSETNCKKCVGDWDKIHYETCPGYNVLRALRGEEVS